ncbi:helix-turn-helix domain-containing protein [Photobacterium profundum]|uniref:HTH cro/C1-type domain-containing protein n=1 Tax=Photobacterium profundum (strain SS9) TaxID=298386 RepID=Q6LSJ2_PHOPR|nr:ImmA/IrrE family metallo-endopeptidase [Photobacterium profundum]CAG19734.1 hypothetical protein PBPRA1323 [Photobacterium profundum SS9]
MKSGVGGFQSNRLTQARESLGLTKVALATLVNVSGATVTNWENGKQNPQGDKLQALSIALGQPVHWFLRELAAENSSPYFFRSLTAATKSGREATKIKLDWIAELSTILNQWLDWPTLRIPEVNKNFKAISDEDIELSAIEFRNNFNLGNSPIKDLSLSVENSGVIFSRCEIGFDKLDGLSSWNKITGRPYILLATDKDNAIRSRFDLAHELGHIILHKNVKVDDINQTAHKEIERQANLFASCLLLPADSFARDLENPTLETFLALKPRWKVSIAAMIYRAHQLDIISDLQKSNLYKNLSSKGWRIKEPYDDQVKPENPRLLPRAINMLIDQGGFSKNILLDKLGFSTFICEELCGLPRGFFDDDTEEDNLVTLRFQNKTTSNNKKNYKSETSNIVRFGR